MTKATTDRSNPVADQITASVAQAFNDVRATQLGQAVDRQLAAFEDALNEMENVRGFLRDPAGQLGNPKTKHGEIAEAIEVGIRRAHDCLDEVEKSAHMDGIARTGPVDYILNETPVQSKFVNGTAYGLREVIGHMNDHAPFVEGGGEYVIPKDQYAMIERVLGGETAGMKPSTVRAIEKHIQEIGERTGRPPLQVLKPSISTYSDVQPGKVEITMGHHQEEVEQHHEQRNGAIHDAHKASFQEGLGATAAAAAVGGAVSFASAVFKKYKEGKNLFRGDFNAQDWRDVGGEAAIGTAGGAFTGAAVYLMTNSAELSAPLAGAFIAAVKGLRPLVMSYSRGEISALELVDGGLFVCCDVAMIGVCTAAGQTLIPIPVLGALIGAIAGKFLSTLLQSKLNHASEQIQARLDTFLQALDKGHRKLVAVMVERYDSLGSLASRAFDLESNTALMQLSAELAHAQGVPAHLILRDENDLDCFMLN